VLHQQQKSAELVLRGAQTHYGMYGDAPPPEHVNSQRARRRASRRSSLVSSQLHIPRTPAEVRAAARAPAPTTRVAASWKVSFAPPDVDVCDTANSVMALAYVAGEVLSQTLVMSYGARGVSSDGPASFEVSAADALATYVESAYTAVRTARDTDVLAAGLATAFAASGLGALFRPRGAGAVAIGGVQRELVSLTSASTQRALAALTTFELTSTVRSSGVDLSASAIGGACRQREIVGLCAWCCRLQCVDGTWPRAVVDSRERYAVFATSCYV
jgi:hypothetical protein